MLGNLSLRRNVEWMRSTKHQNNGVGEWGACRKWLWQKELILLRGNSWMDSFSENPYNQSLDNMYSVGYDLVKKTIMFEQLHKITKRAGRLKTFCHWVIRSDGRLIWQLQRLFCSVFVCVHAFFLGICLLEFTFSDSWGFGSGQKIVHEKKKANRLILDQVPEMKLRWLETLKKGENQKKRNQKPIFLKQKLFSQISYDRFSSIWSASCRRVSIFHHSVEFPTSKRNSLYSACSRSWCSSLKLW